MIFTRLLTVLFFSIASLSACATKSSQQASGVGIVMNGIQNNPDMNCESLEKARDKNRSESEEEICRPPSK